MGRGVFLLSMGLKKAWHSSHVTGWGYVWVTWRLLLFGPVSAAYKSGEEVPTAWGEWQWRRR